MKGRIKIEALHNGAHENQLGQFEHIPEGWALIPDDLELPETFPFVDITVETFAAPEPDPEAEEGQEVVQEGVQEAVQEVERYGVPIVTSMTAGVMPEPTPDYKGPTVWDEMDAAYQEGVNDV